MNDTDARRALTAIVAVVGRPYRDLKAVADALAAVRRIDTPVRREPRSRKTPSWRSAARAVSRSCPQALAILGGDRHVSEGVRRATRGMGGVLGFSCPMAGAGAGTCAHRIGTRGRTRRAGGVARRCAARRAGGSAGQ